MSEYLLFLVPSCGPDHMLRNKLKREEIEIPFISLSDGLKETKELYQKYNIRTTPVLLEIDDDIVINTIKGTDDIVKELKKLKD